MQEIKEKTPLMDNIEHRNDEIDTILACKLNSAFQVTTYNFNSWKSTFYQKLRVLEKGLAEGLKKKFKIKTMPNDNPSEIEFTTFKIWRIK